MNRVIIRLTASAAFTAAIALTPCVPTIAQDRSMSAEQPAAMTQGQEKLAKMLEGRVAGEPQSCIRLFPVNNFRIIDETALVYKNGSTLYVNVPRNADDLDDWDGIVTRPLGTRLCRTDIVTTFERNTGTYTGNIFLGDFVPYKRVDG